jgi:ParB family protein of integrating conjugative element (PFGI_1 class)
MTSPKSPRNLGLPITMSATEIVSNLNTAKKMDDNRKLRRGVQINTGGLKPADAPPFGTSDPKLTVAQVEAQRFRASYLVSDTTPSKVDLSVTDVPGYMQLEVTAIDSYDHNPRQWKNEKYDEIFSSIEEGGFTGSLTVTRRRPGERYMLAAGSNTTLQILQALWAETGDEKYRWVDCIFQPYSGETRVLAQHLGENLNRGDMKFWEVAKGMCDLLALIEQDRAKPPGHAPTMNLREQAEALTKCGLRADKNSVSRWRMAVERLSTLGSATARLTSRGMRDTIQPRLVALRSLSAKFKIVEDEFWSAIVEPVLASYGKDVEAAPDDFFDASALCDRVEAALAERVEESVARVRQMLSVLKLSPELTLADLRMPSPNVMGASTRSASTAAEGGSAEANPAQGASAPHTKQAPLPLGPGQVRGTGAHPPASSGSNHAAVPGEAAEAQTPPPSSQPVADLGSLFDQPAASDDPLKDLHDAVAQLLQIANLTDVWRSADEMPLGFFAELPDPQIHARRKVQLGSPEFYARTVKSVVWWSLVFMTGQYREGAVPFLDKSSEFYKHFSSDEGPNALDGTDIENQQPDPHELQIHRITPGALREATRQLRTVEECAARVLERLPDRRRRMLQIYGSQA